MSLRTRAAVLAMCCAFLSSFVGCRSKEAVPIQKYFREELGQLRKGTSVSKFRELFPDAILERQNGRITAYELTLEQDYTVGEGEAWEHENKSIQKLYFVFADDQLESWSDLTGGESPPDLIIEQRHR